MSRGWLHWSSACVGSSRRAIRRSGRRARTHVFQQLSLRAASAIMHRLILAVAMRSGGGLPVPLYVFSRRGAFPARGRQAAAGNRPQREQDRDIAAGRRSAPVWRARCSSARTVHESGRGGDAAPDQRHRPMDRGGHSPAWPRASRVFPANDSSVASNIALAAGSAPLDVQRLLDALGPQRGMLSLTPAARKTGRPRRHRPPIVRKIASGRSTRHHRRLCRLSGPPSPDACLPVHATASGFSLSQIAPSPQRMSGSGHEPRHLLGTSFARARFHRLFTLLRAETDATTVLPPFCR